MGIYCIIIGACLFAFEFPCPCYREIPGVSKIWCNYLFRGGIYFILAIPCYAVGIGIISGFAFSLLSVVYMFCWLKGESAEDPKDVIEYSNMHEQLVESFKGEEEGDEDTDSEDLD